MNYPENLYKYHPEIGAAKYVKVKDDVYEDTTCLHEGPHCRVKVKQVGDHWEYVEGDNFIAYKYEDVHKTDSAYNFFYADKISSEAAIYHAKKEMQEDSIRETKQKLNSVIKELSEKKVVQLSPQDIKDLDFGDELILVNSDTNAVSNAKVDKKVFDKSGLLMLITDSDIEIRNTDTHCFLQGSFTGSDYFETTIYENFICFTSQKDFDANKNNEAIKVLEMRRGDLQRSLTNCERNLREIEEELSQLKQGEEV